MIFETMTAALLAELSLDELDEENQRAGDVIEEIRVYRKQVKDARSVKSEAADIRAKHGDDLSDEQVEAISAVVKAPRLSMKAGVNDG